MKLLRKTAAWVIVAAVVPVVVDAATDPYASRSIPRSWLYGAVKTAGLGLFSWALRETVNADEMPPEVMRGEQN